VMIVYYNVALISICTLLLVELCLQSKGCCNSSSSSSNRGISSNCAVAERSCSDQLLLALMPHVETHVGFLHNCLCIGRAQSLANHSF
jgi:hypothetical protein